MSANNYLLVLRSTTTRNKLREARYCSYLIVCRSISLYIENDKSENETSNLFGCFGSPSNRNTGMDEPHEAINDRSYSFRQIGVEHG